MPPSGSSELPPLDRPDDHIRFMIKPSKQSFWVSKHAISEASTYYRKYFEEDRESKTTTVGIEGDASARVIEIVLMWLQFDLRGHLIFERGRAKHGEAQAVVEISTDRSEAEKFHSALDELFDVYVFASRYDLVELRNAIMIELSELYLNHMTDIPGLFYVRRAGTELGLTSRMTKFLLFCYAKNGALDPDEEPGLRDDLLAMPKELLVEWLLVVQKVSMSRGEALWRASDTEAFDYAISPCQWLHKHEDEEEEMRCRREMLDL
ncbi:hypothetical protein BU16DRAFT_530065 [Lophium mytilinum]|uniref:BTB domain-containing protein n=1 Tax=Lophium mytilinum TaxID=390894 RepID=A0A6A6QJE7_9PEZI|nr:hypothetical protein BU16DRAFT_530065 [Lophium mytilinum]